MSDGEYTIRRTLDGSWLMGNRWEILWNGKNWLSVPAERIPVGCSSAATRRGAIKKIRRLERLRARRETQTLAGVPLDDLRSEIVR